MADPRASAGIVGVDAVFITAKIDDSTITYDSTKEAGSAQVGLAVNFSADQTVQLAGSGEVVIGKLIKVESDNFATVQVGGGMTLPGGTSATLTVGTKIMGDLLVAAKGYIQTVSADAAGALVGRGFIYDASDTDNVQIMLDA